MLVLDNTLQEEEEKITWEGIEAAGIKGKELKPHLQRQKS
jgi:hypothetical protein